ncbi:L-asparaginase [Cryptotermes secundus]|uniref:asparaginase n=2 Tax=Cryptotermes secundus TaxID=105785 RepID=A0A2J7Q619_9NEOP|nr:L-asparaginase [Cryptotermes secundus]
MHTERNADANHLLSNHETNHYHTPSASEIFLRTFRSGPGIPSGPISRSKEGESRVLVLYTGGTIGMMKDDKKAYVPIPNAFEKYIRRIPYMHDEEYVGTRLSATEKSKFLVLPEMTDKTRVLYHIQEYSQLLDSSNMAMDSWIQIALDIQKSYEAYDGFVILHGTDTLAYTASALSFMFENLGKTVIVTGSQIPVFESRSDGRDNILGALVLAGNYVIPEVTVFFRNNLFRGNRTMKKSTDAFFAFDSPNMPPIAKIGINIEVNAQAIFRPSTIEKFRVHPTLNPNVGLLRLFPNITIQAVRAFFQPPIEGVVLQTYGAGNIPSNRIDLMEELKAASRRGILIINCTQCIEGSVCSTYETGMILAQAGIIPGVDMTPEAALTKLSYVLSKTDWDLNTKRELMQRNLRGELSSGQDGSTKPSRMLTNYGLITKEDQAELESVILPACIIQNVIEGNIPELEDLKNSGADFSSENGDFRTPLHIACCEGNLEMVEYLLLNGACIHMKDRYGITPLLDAIHFDNHDIIKLLMKCGAHLPLAHSRNVGEELCSAAAKGSLKRLQSFQFAGADLSQPDFSGNTALHIIYVEGARPTQYMDCFNKVHVSSEMYSPKYRSQ